LGSAGLFLLGGAFGYFVAFRYGMTFLLGIGKNAHVLPLISIEDYFDRFVDMMLGIGVAFELPILLFFLTLIRVVSPGFLLGHSEYVIMAIVILAAIITPTPDVFAHEPEYMKGSLAALPAFVQRAGCSVVLPVMLRVGLLRLMGNPGAGRLFGLANLTGTQRQELIFLSNNPAIAQTEGEGCVLDESMAEVRAAGDFGNRPLVVLAGSTPFQAPGSQYLKETEALNDYWFHDLQPRLAALSTRGRLVIEEHAEEPDAVAGAVRSVVAAVRAEGAP
jgi:hypothetical protein